ncbi:ABC transporter permease, partial [Patescibacteria group bacterium]|nr:ABC transporter permease [Patescibacteria group bacterium]
HTFKIAVRNLKINKSRSVLTILGIVIGVTAIIFIMSLGAGAKDLIVGEITSLGADIIWIEPGREPQGLTDFTGTILSNTLKDKDIDALKKDVAGIADIAPAVSVPGSISYGSETYRPMIMGWSADFFARVFKILPKEGFYFDETAVRNQERVAVIGSKVKEELFGESEAVGKSIKINKERFRVTAVLPDKGQIFFFDIGDFVIIPYTTAKTYLLGIDYYNEVWVQVKNVNEIPLVIEDIKMTLREKHNITDPEKDDFYILTQQNMIDQVDSILNILTMAIAAIVAISLVVGGVGVMNIMLVSVTERTREIGLRKALGATEKDIVYQFLVEAVILTILGGIIGVGLGTLMSYVSVTIFTQITGSVWNFTFPFLAAILGFLVSGGVGLIFGIYPARQASKKSPIESLRYE